ncbi:MAG: hypothetical protein L6371_03250 [Candidatus Atribacteria bacterium]|nr:hypothetical protein [Candidatus Atribacteria bacterium]
MCQGGKDELEEITGERYEYIKPEEIKSLFPEYKPTLYSRNTFPTFIEIYTTSTSSRKTLKREIYKKALELNADAVIHYKQNLFKVIHGSLIGFAEGTPMRKKKVKENY